MDEQDFYRKCIENEYGFDKESHGRFLRDAEEAFDFAHFPRTLKSMIHSKAWEEGHSAGYHEVATHYSDLVDIAKEAQKPNTITENEQKVREFLAKRTGSLRAMEEALNVPMSVLANYSSYGIVSHLRSAGTDENDAWGQVLENLKITFGE